MSKICLTLAEKSLTSLQEKIERYSDQVDLIEVRLDYLEVLPEFQSLSIESGAQMLATCRPSREGGQFTGAESERLEILSRAAQAGFHWVDLEHDVTEDLALPAITRVVRSLHLFDQFPEDLDGCLQKLDRSRSDVLKLACQISNSRQAIQLLKWMESLPDRQSRVIIGMGVWGQLTRILGNFLGNSWTYVCEQESANVAPGQFDLATARGLYRLDEWMENPLLYGVLAYSVEHFQSPLLHNMLFQEYGLESLYMPIQLDDLKAWFEYLKHTHLEFQGFSVTIPFKTEVGRFLRRSESPVETVNTLVREGSDWIGSNTDRMGFLRPLESRISKLEGKTALVLGNGGVAHSVTDILLTKKVRVTVAGRNRNRLAHFAAQHKCKTLMLDELPFEADICVNTTPVGQYPDMEASPIAEEAIRFECVYDLIYNPERTQLLRLAESKGLKTISGIEMFIEQGAEQFSRWTGIDPDRQLMKSILRQNG